MTTTTAEVFPRPAAGIELEPGRLQQWMDLQVLSPARMSARIAELGLLPFRHVTTRKDPLWADRHAVVPDEVRKHCTACGRKISALSVDAVIKIANGTRKPRAATLDAICGVLGLQPSDLMPGSRPPSRDEEARRRVAEYNAGMRDYADSIGRPDLYERPGKDGEDQDQLLRRAAPPVGRRTGTPGLPASVLTSP